MTKAPRRSKAEVESQGKLVTGLDQGGVDAATEDQTMSTAKETARP